MLEIMSKDSMQWTFLFYNPNLILLNSVVLSKSNHRISDQLSNRFENLSMEGFNHEKSKAGNSTGVLLAMPGNKLKSRK
jgi:hypothetical protein